MSSSDIKFPPLPLPAPAIFGAEQMTQYARETVRLNQPIAGLRLDGLLISTGSWDVVRAVQAALLHRGVKTETCNLTGAPAPETSVTFSVDVPYARYAVRNVDVPFSAETVTLHRKGREPVAISVRALGDHVDGKEKLRKMAEPEPFDVKRARAGEPVQTRDGRPVKFVAYFSLMEDSQQVICTLTDNPKLGYHFRFADGRYNRDGVRSANDLVMAPKPKRTVWVNTLKNPALNGAVSLAFVSEEAALSHARCARAPLASIAVQKEIE